MRSKADAGEERRQRFIREAERLQGEIERFTEAIRLGGPLASLVKALQAAEQQRADVLAQVEHLDGLARASTPWADDVREEIRRRLADRAATMDRQPAEARQALRQLIVVRPTMTPKVAAEGRYYEITGQASYGALLTGVVGLVPPG